MLLPAVALASATSTIRIEIIPAAQCGDGIDNDDDGATDYPSDPGCTDATDTNETNASSSSGGGVSAPNAATTVTFSGLAYPAQDVTLLKDAQVAGRAVAGADGTFSITLSGLSAGNYLFSVYAEDRWNTRSALLTFPVGVTRGASTNVMDIHLAPTIAAAAAHLTQGETIDVFGQSVPRARITLTLSGAATQEYDTTADVTGEYHFALATTGLAPGTYTAKASSTFGGTTTEDSSTLSLFIDDGSGTTPVATAQSDINRDGRVNIVDFSIMAFWYKRADVPANVDMNSDRKVDLIDLSILAFHWTG